MVTNARDTIEFAATAQGRRCGGRRGILLEGISGGNGVLLWVHSGNGPVPGMYPLLTFGDTSTPHGAVATARFMVGLADRGVALDSGAVELAVNGGRIEATASGSGIEPAAGERVTLRASFHDVRLAPDTVGCGVQPVR